MSELSVVTEEEALYQQVTGFIDEARGRVARTVNTAMVEAYWRIGRAIVEVEQRGEKRAGYGDKLITRLAARLGASGTKGMSVFNLKYMRRFFLAFPRGSFVPERRSKASKSLTNIGRTPSNQSRAPVAFHPALSWSHYGQGRERASPSVLRD